MSHASVGETGRERVRGGWAGLGGEERGENGQSQSERKERGRCTQSVTLTLQNELSVAGDGASVWARLPWYASITSSSLPIMAAT